MSRRVENPVEERDDRGGSTERHPAYGMIGASRVSSGGAGAVLFGSDFTHNHFVTLRIHEASMHRDLSRDWPHATRQLIEVSMSEAQWAAFVSSLNMGDGVQCTLERVGMEEVPGLPHPTARHDQFKDELRRALMDGTGALADAVAQLKEMGGDKSKAGAVRALVERAQRAFADSMPWVAQQFGEHMEDVTEKARIEISAHAISVIQRTGIAALRGEPPPVELPRAATPPAPPPPPAASSQPTVEKPAGTLDTRDSVIKSMGECTTLDALASLAEQADAYQWTGPDLGTINAAYHARMQALSNDTGRE